MMTIGPVQLLVFGFNDDDFRSRITVELGQLRASGTVRVIDSLVVYKDADGEIEVGQFSEQEPGRVIGALIGLVVAGEDDLELADVELPDAIDPLSEPEGWDVLLDIPADTAAALMLIEHQWAVPLRETIARAGGFRISDGFIDPFDLQSIGLVTAAEAKSLDAMDSGPRAQ